jgi:GAF domain-containing protein/HAMP domain-containing protein
MEQQPFSKPRTEERSRWFRPGDWSIQVKVLLGMVAVVMLALGVATAVNAFSLYTDLREEIGTNFQNLAANQVSSLSEILSKQLTMLQSLTLVHEVQDSAVTASARYDGDQETIEAELLEMDQQWLAAADDSQLVQSILDPRSNRITRQLLGFMESFPDHVEIFMTDRYGGLLASTGRTSDYYQADEGWWQAAYNGGQGAFYIGQPEYDESAGYTALNMAIPIYGEDGQIAGIVRTTFRVDAVYQAVSALRLGETGHVAIIDSAGLIVADPNLEHIGEAVPQSWLATEIVDAASGWQELVDAEGDSVLAGHASFAAATLENQAEEDAVRSLGWVLFLAQLQSEAYAPVTGAVWRGILAAGAFALVAAGLALVVARALVTPITDLAAVARRMAGGDLSVRARSLRRDETGELAEAFNGMADEIAGMLGTLEQRVAERTRDLEAAADVAHATTSLLDPGELLHQVVDLVCDRFGLYYVGLFLVDEEQRFAILRAGTGDAGAQMLAQGHKLEVGGDSMIGRCVASGTAAIALDVGEEPQRFDNPLLPDTRSEMALPLRIRGRVVGAMTVQDTVEAAFQKTDIAVMQTMADQVAVAIDNARLFAETQTALEEMEAIHRRYLGRAWAEYAGTRARRGYAQTEAGLVPLSAEMLPETQQAMMERRTVISQATADTGGQERAPSPALVVPILQLDQPIGALGVKEPDGGRQWTAEEIALAEAIAEQFALAADNLRLLEETQRRAARDRLLSEVTARMRETLDVRTVLETTADQLYQILDLDKVVIRLTTDGSEGDSA